MSYVACGHCSDTDVNRAFPWLVPERLTPVACSCPSQCCYIRHCAGKNCGPCTVSWLRWDWPHYTARVRQLGYSGLDQGYKSTSNHQGLCWLLNSRAVWVNISHFCAHCYPLAPISEWWSRPGCSQCPLPASGVTQPPLRLAAHDLPALPPRSGPEWPGWDYRPQRKSLSAPWPAGGGWPCHLGTVCTVPVHGVRPPPGSGDTGHEFCKRR